MVHGKQEMQKPYSITDFFYFPHSMNIEPLRGALRCVQTSVRMRQRGSSLFSYNSRMYLCGVLFDQNNDRTYKILSHKVEVVQQQGTTTNGYETKTSYTSSPTSK